MRYASTCQRDRRPRCFQMTLGPVSAPFRSSDFLLQGTGKFGGRQPIVEALGEQVVVGMQGMPEAALGANCLNGGSRWQRKTSQLQRLTANPFSAAQNDVSPGWARTMCRFMTALGRCLTDPSGAQRSVPCRQRSGRSDTCEQPRVRFADTFNTAHDEGVRHRFADLTRVRDGLQHAHRYNAK